MANKLEKSVEKISLIFLILRKSCVLLKTLMLLIIWILLVSNMLFAWSVWHIMAGGNRIERSTADRIIFLAKLPSEFYHEFLVFSGLGPSELSIPNKSDNYKTKNLSGYILVSTISHKNKFAEIQLLDLSNGKILHKWQPDISGLNLKDISKYNLRLAHPLFYKTDIITNAGGNLIRLNKSSEIVWQNDAIFHHSIELDAENLLWVCGTIEKKSNDNSIQSNIGDDAIIKVNPTDGKILFRKSIYEILIENGYQNLLFNTGPLNEDLIHLNDIQPALNTTKYWQKGDLLMSIRNRSTIFLYRPHTNKIIWLKTGPWNFQHDCDFLSDHEIGVFGNDVAELKGKRYLLNGHNNQYIVDLETGLVSTPYTKMFKQGKIKTLTEGRSRILPDGQLFVEETNNGRILFGDKNGVKGTYVNRLDKEYIGMLAWSRYYTNQEFSNLKN